jgi:hypothetical protein
MRVSFFSCSSQLSALTTYTNYYTVSGDNAKKYLDLLKELGFAFYDIHETTEKLEPITAAELLKRYPVDEAYHTDLLCVRGKLTF